MKLLTTLEAEAFASSYDGDFGFMVAMRERVQAGGDLTHNMLLAISRCAARATRDAATPILDDADLEPGMYLDAEGNPVRVQRSRESGNLYAKRLVQINGDRLRDADEDVVHFEFQYAPGVIRTLSSANRMSLEQAQAFGIRYGVCCVCGLHLKDAKSVALGIGPICRKRV